METIYGLLESCSSSRFSLPSTETGGTLENITSMDLVIRWWMKRKCWINDLRNKFKCSGVTEWSKDCNLIKESTFLHHYQYTKWGNVSWKNLFFLLFVIWLTITSTDSSEARFLSSGTSGHKKSTSVLHKSFQGSVFQYNVKGPFLKSCTDGGCAWLDGETSRQFSSSSMALIDIT